MVCCVAAALLVGLLVRAVRAIRARAARLFGRSEVAPAQLFAPVAHRQVDADDVVSSASRTAA